MILQLKKYVDLKANIQDLVDDYKIIIALHNTVNFLSPINKKEIQLYHATVKSLSKIIIILSKQVEIVKKNKTLRTTNKRIVGDLLYHKITKSTLNMVIHRINAEQQKALSTIFETYMRK